jgi:Signal transduction histidine kinase
MIKDAFLVISVLAVLILLIRIIVIKKNLREVRKELNKTKDEGYNRQIKVALADRDVEAIAAEINHNLDYQKQLKLETEKSRRQLEQSISDIAHDLRTPLTVIKGNLQLLKQEELSSKGRESLEISARKANTLKNMVDEFFEMSVLESDTGEVSLEKIDIVNWLAEFIIENEILIREKGLEPEICFPDKSIIIRANKDMLNRVFSNLMTNIFKYAYKNFQVGVTESEGKCIIKVGNLVEEPDKIEVEHIFDRTYRADKARSSGSAGLGLYIAKLLVEKQKGTIAAEIEDDKLIFTMIFSLLLNT